MENRQSGPSKRGTRDRSGAWRMMEVRNLSFQYPGGDFSLRVPELSLAGGEAVALVGPSGAGKTTLVHLLAGILAPLSGKVLYEGLDLGGLGEADRRDFRALRVGLVFQEFELLEYLNVLDNILLPFRISPVLALTPEAAEHAGHLAASIGLGDKLQRLPARLSQGERQRIAVCRALVTRPALVFGDEPTGNLDVKNRDLVMDLVFRYAKEHNAALMVITHDPELQQQFDRRVQIQDFTHG